MSSKKEIRKGVFIPAISVMITAAVIGLVNNEWLTSASKAAFKWTLDTWGWLYQILSIVALILIIVVTFSKYGNIRIGGKDAKAKIPFSTWFFMALTGGIATGITTWGVNEPIIYYGNIWGELNKVGIEPFTEEAAVFSMARNFYNWTFIPYAVYVLSGLLTAYLYFNKKGKLSVSATLKPIFGKHAENKAFINVIDVLSLLAIALGLTSGLVVCISLVVSALSYVYGVNDSIMLYIGLGSFIAFLFSISSFVGMDKGLQRVADLNGKIYYGILILLITVGPTLFIVNLMTDGFGYWLQNFWNWGLDTGYKGGDALVKSWTLFDWSVWFAYAPVMGIFIAMISYGRTIKQFMIVNWILPSVFGIFWFGVWGATAIKWQQDGVVDLVGAIQDFGAVTALWAFLHNLPWGIGTVIVPIMIFTVIISYVTAADATTTTLASMCLKDVDIAKNEEAPASQKLAWGVTIAIIAIILAAFGGGEQGVDGVKQLAAAAGFVVLFVFTLQVASFIKVFFIDKPSDDEMN